MVQPRPHVQTHLYLRTELTRGVWDRGREGDEIEDFIEEEHITTSKPRRRSNSNSNVANGNGGAGGAGAGTTAAGAVKSKFEVNDIDEEAVDEQQQ